MKKKTQNPRLKSKNYNWAGLKTKEEIFNHINNNLYTSNELAQVLQLTPKTIKNAIGEMRLLNNTTKSPWAIVTVRDSDGTLLYKMMKKQIAKRDYDLSVRFLSNGVKDTYYVR